MIQFKTNGTNENCVVRINGTVVTNNAYVYDYGDYGMAWVEIEADEGYVFDENTSFNLILRPTDEYGNPLTDEYGNPLTTYLTVTTGGSWVGNWNSTFTKFTYTLDQYFMGTVEVNNAVAVEEADDEPVYEVQAIFDVENVDVFVNDIPVADRDVFDRGAPEFVLRIVCHEGYAFNETTPFDITFNGEGLLITTTDPLFSECWNEDYTVFEIEFEGFDPLSEIFLNLDNVSPAEITGEEPDFSPANVFALIYSPTPEQLESLSRDRYITLGSTGYIEYLDMGKYFHNLYSTPFDLSEHRLPTATNVLVGGRSLDTKACLMESSVVEIDLGTIEVPPKYNNAYDYVNTACYLHVPFMNSVELDVARVIGKVVHAEYVLDLYSGKATLNIYSDGLIMNSIEVNLGLKIPFYQHLTDTITWQTTSNMLLSTVTTPYIEVVRNIPYDETGVYGFNRIESGVIGDYTGFVVVSSVQLTTNATRVEQREIERLLAGGVYL